MALLPVLYIYSSRLSQNYVKSWFGNGYLSDYSAVIATTSCPFTDYSQSNLLPKTEKLDSTE